MFHKKALTYQSRLFLISALCIWLVLGCVAYLEYQNKQQMMINLISSRATFSVGNILRSYKQGYDIKPYMAFMENYFRNTEFEDLRISVYETHTGRLLNAIGEPSSESPHEFDTMPYDTLYDGSSVKRINYVTMPSGREMFFCSRRISSDGNLTVYSYLPINTQVEGELTVAPAFWSIIIGAGLIGTLLAYIITAHQAKNVKLLHDFARRAAEDRDFIPMGDFPADEIGDISRQIVAIYNSRMQANVRREREHTIAIEATEEKNRTKRMLTDNISHELKTPIGIIKAYLDMVINQRDMPEEDRMHFLRKAQQNVERLVSMLNELSTMTRLEESFNNIPLKEIDFRHMILNFVDDIIESGITKGMKFNYDIPEGCIVLGNEELLNSVLNNLVKNSVAYSQGTEMGIEMLGHTHSHFTFKFYDNGTGVADNHIPKLFDRFYRIDTGRSRKTGGTGLGLPIVKSAINTMGGSISVRNRSTESGLEFIFTLRRPKGSEQDDSPTSTENIKSSETES